MKQDIKNIIFDVGDVLIEYRWKQMLMDYGLEQAQAEQVGGLLFDDPDGIWTSFDSGLISKEAAIEAYSKKYPEYGKVIAWFIHHGEYMVVARPQVWERVHELKEAGYRIYLLSNYSEELFKKHTEYADFMNDIDGMMVSYMIKKVKPDLAIYDALVKKYNLKPEESIFFDDRLANVEASRSYGIEAIQVHSKESLLEELRVF